MSGRPRIYLAIGIFYDPERLNAAASALVAYGFSAETLWRLAERAPARAGQPRLSGKDWRDRFELKALPAEMLAGASHDELEDGADLSGLCLDVIMASNAGAEVKRHAENGATILVAGTEGSELHDKCVKVLLRHSLHTVHSQELSLPV